MQRNTRLPVAALQMNSGLDKRANWATAERLVAEAARGGARLVVLPEMFNLFGDLSLAALEAEPIPGPTSELLAAWAARWSLVLCGGSFCEQSGVPGKAYNTSLVFGSGGDLLVKYRKIHLFDVDLPGKVVVQESASILPGNAVAAAALAGFTCGLAICYDLRFSELFRTLTDRGMETLLLPAAFTRQTGQAHWELLVRARAVENQVFAIAANQAGWHSERSQSYGHSLIVDPWGELLAAAGDEPERILHAVLERERLDAVRAQAPVLAHRRRIE